MDGDPYDLERFVAAQAPVYDRVRTELEAGRKRSHWMWFVFPQMAGLGFSAMSQRYAIASLGEAQAYLAHPLLGSRLREGVELVLNAGADGRTAHDIFGSPDDMKFHSSLTLFDRAEPGGVFAKALVGFFDERLDQGTLRILGKG